MDIEDSRKCNRMNLKKVVKFGFASTPGRYFVKEKIFSPVKLHLEIVFISNVKFLES